MKIGVAGVGYVGGAVGTFFIDKGEEVFLYDKYKNGMQNIDVLLDCDIVFLCLPTLVYENGTYDLEPLYDVSHFLCEAEYEGLVVIKSTVMPGTCRELSNTFNLRVVHNPEFLTARRALADFYNPTQIVIGGWSQDSKQLAALYRKHFFGTGSAVTTDITLEEAEMMKVACNAFYAVKVQFFNELFAICKKEHAKYENVKDMMLANGWINPMHTDVPGQDGKLSYGGACVIPNTNILSANSITKASDLKSGDTIYDGYNYVKVTKVGMRKVDSVVSITSRGRNICGSKDHIHMVYDKDNKRLKEKLLSDIKNDDWVYLPKPHFAGHNKVYLGEKPRLKGVKFWKESQKITNDIARLFGLYVAEGYSNIYSYQTKNRVKKDYTVCWTFGPNEEYLADEIIRILDSIGIKAKKKFKISPNATFGESRTWQVRKRSLWLYTLITNAGLGNNAHNKNVKFYSNDLAKSFISGWLDGDGSFYLKTNTISGFSRSKELISKIDLMLLSLGIEGSIQKDGQEINISKRNDVKEILSWSNHPKFNVSPKYKTKYIWSSPNSRKYKDGWITKVKYINEINESQDVISIETESGYYITNNMLTHNCFPKDTKALLSLMKEKDSIHGILEACVNERDSMRDD